MGGDWPFRYVLPVTLVIEAALAASIVGDIANVSTHRLYLSARIDAPTSGAVQRFDVENSRVVPQVVVRDTHDRMAFRVDGAWPATLRVGVRPSASAQYEVRWREPGADALLARGTSDRPTEVAASIPARRGVVELISGDALTWVDPRIVTDLRIRKRAIALLALTSVAAWAWRRRAARRLTRTLRIAIYKWSAAASGVGLAIVGLEAGLRALGNLAPPPILAERHDLGEVRRDPRWQDTARYGRRLRAHVNDTSEWRYGDIVRMGFIPAAVSDGVAHRFPFHTDAEGFRNERTRNRIDVAALGDSFTDAMTIDAAAAWPTRIEQQTGLAVQNYGTAGFGPQQELRVLTDFALPHQPRIVVLAYFAGNDIFDAEAFEQYERSHGAIRRSDPGWPIKHVVSRADTWYLVSAFHAVRKWVSSRERVEAQAVTPADRSDATPRVAPIPTFDRGIFTIAVNGRPLRWAFMPPYLNTLRMSKHDLASRTGWRLTEQAIAAMRDASRAAGAEFIVMFLPAKSQIYLPILASTLPRDEVVRDLRYALPDGAIDLPAMLRNRRAQNELMRAFCDAHGIMFVDTTDVLEARVRRGENVYFPDESHLNETGHALVAETVATFLPHR